MSAQKITINKNSPESKLNHYWSKCVGSGHAYLAMREDYRQHLIDAVRECGFEYIRFHGILHDDMMIYHEDKKGTPFYNWQYLDNIFDLFLEIGIKPFVELSFIPSILASGKQTIFYWKANVTSPKDYDKWANLIYAFALHCKKRYGLGEIESWYWEVWNEPTLAGFWSADINEYFKLYEYSVNALKKVSLKLKVGGPASHNFQPKKDSSGEWEGLWIRELLDFCKAKKLPIDFISTHPYPTDFPIDGVTKKHKQISRRHSSLKDDIDWIVDTVKKSPFPDIEIHLTEWNSSPSARDFNHDHLFAASFIIEHNLNNTGKVNSLSYWTFSDVFEEQGAGDTIFHGGFGLINLQGLRKPSFHAYRFLHRLGNRVLKKGDGYIVTKDNNDYLKIFLWNYVKTGKTIPMVSRTPEDCDTNIPDGQTKEFLLDIPLPNKKVKVTETFLTKTSGSVFDEWLKIRKTESPTREEIAYLKKKMVPNTKQKLIRSNKFTKRIFLKEYEVAFIEIGGWA